VETKFFLNERRLKMGKLSPFHESVVVVIRDMPELDFSRATAVLDLLVATTIPANHDSIIQALDSQRWLQHTSYLRAAMDSLTEQKAAAEVRVATPDWEEKARALMGVLKSLIDANASASVKRQAAVRAGKIFRAKTRDQFQEALSISPT
jgi:hypothetical protein